MPQDRSHPDVGDEQVSETLVFSSTLTRLIALEDFNTDSIFLGTCSVGFFLCVEDSLTIPSKAVDYFC
jgi:hypothetical protein